MRTTDNRERGQKPKGGGERMLELSRHVRKDEETRG